MNNYWNYFELPFQSTEPWLEVENKLLYQLNKPVADPGIPAEVGLDKPAGAEPDKPAAENDKPGVGSGKPAEVEPGLGVGAVVCRSEPGEGNFVDSFATAVLADSIAEGRPEVLRSALKMSRKEQPPVRFFYMVNILL